MSELMCQPPTVFITFNFEIFPHQYIFSHFLHLYFFQNYQDFPPCCSIQSWLSSLDVLYADDDSCIAIETADTLVPPLVFVLTETSVYLL